MQAKLCWATIPAFVVGLVLGASWLRPSEAGAQGDKKLDLAAEVALLKNKEADQAHVMMDVSFHFGNLWFAGQKKNWPLAEFYLGETKSHLRWAVRIKPLRQDSAKQTIKLGDILEALENTPFKDLHTAIQAKDSAAFEKAYKVTLEGCYACHKATEKPYLRPGIPTRAPEAVLQFEAEKSE